MTTTDPYGRWHVLRQTGRMGEHVAPALQALAPPLPVPEVPARDVQPHEIPRSARLFAGLARAHGWTVRVTYARGPRIHALHGTVLRIVDCIAVRARRGRDRLAGVWVDGRFDTGLIWNHGELPAEVGATELRARLAPHMREEAS